MGRQDGVPRSAGRRRSGVTSRSLGSPQGDRVVPAGTRLRTPRPARCGRWTAHSERWEFVAPYANMRRVSPDREDNHGAGRNEAEQGKRRRQCKNHPCVRAHDKTTGRIAARPSGYRNTCDRCRGSATRSGPRTAPNSVSAPKPALLTAKTTRSKARHAPILQRSWEVEGEVRLAADNDGLSLIMSVLGPCDSPRWQCDKAAGALANGRCERRCDESLRPSRQVATAKKVCDYPCERMGLEMRLGLGLLPTAQRRGRGWTEGATPGRRGLYGGRESQEPKNPWDCPIWTGRRPGRRILRILPICWKPQAGGGPGKPGR